MSTQAIKPLSRVFKFRAWDEYNKKPIHIGELEDIMFKPDLDFANYKVQQFTGFFDNEGSEIYEGDILSDWNEVDGEMVQSKLQVFWCQKTGAWKLDSSFKQDMSHGDLLSDELDSGSYEITSNEKLRP